MLNCFERFDQIDERLDRVAEGMVGYNKLLAEHIAATNILRAEVKEAQDHRNEVLNIIVKQAEKARLDQMKTIKITIGVFAALAALVTALAAWLSHGG